MADDGMPDVGLVLPTICIFIASTSTGMTAFGNAIVYHVIWAIFGAFGWVDARSRGSMKLAVLLIQIMQWFTLPMGIYFARKELRRAWRFSLAMAVTGAPMSVVGTNLLYFSGLGPLKVFTGLFFLWFSVWKLSAAAVALARKRLEVLSKPPLAAVAEAGAATDAGTASPGAAATPTAVAGSGEANDLVQVPPSPAWLRSRVPALADWFERVKPISPSHSVAATFTWLSVTGFGAGMLNGLLGAGGPPQMIIFSVLNLGKDIIRAVGVCYGLFELPVRVFMFTSGDGNIFDVNKQWALYSLTIVAAWVGFLLGNLLRNRVSTDVIIRMLFVLVFASSAMLLGALDNVAIAIPYLLLTPLWAGTCLLLWWKPVRFAGCLRKKWACSWRRSSGSAGNSDKLPG